MHCSMRYDDLAKTYAQLVKLDLAKKENYQPLRLYYRRYLGLKNDQFDYWFAGMLDHDTFYDWSYNLALKFLDDLRQKDDNRYVFPVLTLTQAWAEWRNRNLATSGSHPSFESFTDRLKAIAEHTHSEGEALSMAASVLEEIRAMENKLAKTWRQKVPDYSAKFAPFYKEMLANIKKRVKLS